MFFLYPFTTLKRLITPVLISQWARGGGAVYIRTTWPKSGGRETLGTWPHLDAFAVPLGPITSCCLGMTQRNDTAGTETCSQVLTCTSRSLGRERERLGTRLEPTRIEDQTRESSRNWALCSPFMWSDSPGLFFFTLSPTPPEGITYILFTSWL